TQRINMLGQNILNFFPQPNFTDPNPALRYSRNYTAAATGENPRRNTMVRIDVNPTPKLNAYFRWTSDHDTQVTPLTFMNFLFNPVGRLADGHGTATHLTYTARPNLVNEFTFGTAWANPPWVPWGSNPAAVQRSVLGNLPQWFP